MMDQIFLFHFETQIPIDPYLFFSMNENIFKKGVESLIWYALEAHQNTRLLIMIVDQEPDLFEDKGIASWSNTDIVNGDTDKLFYPFNIPMSH